MTPEQFKAYVLKEAKSILEKEMFEEKSYSKSQQRFMGMVRSTQKGETPVKNMPKSVRKAAKDMKPSDVKDFASTKRTGLPEKVPTEESITPESIAQLAQEMKFINESLIVNNPLIAESNIVDDVIGKKEEKRKLCTPLGREYDIEMKESLNETMTNYNDQKHLGHNKETMNETWGRLTNYKRFSD